MIPIQTDWLCLHFVNSVDLRLSVRDEFLTSYEALVLWSRDFKILTANEAQALLAAGTQQPAQAATIFADAITLREAMYRIFSAITHRAAPSQADVALLNRALVRATSQATFLYIDGQFKWTWPHKDQALDSMLWPIIWSVTELLAWPDLRRVRECAGSPGKACGWLFVDTSKNQSRQWCVTALCGNRTRAHRYYERKREALVPE
jgi:predicted RNA-binding Zn ribbon-like protein